jgi:hypothetical protein
MRDPDSTLPRARRFAEAAPAGSNAVGQGEGMRAPVGDKGWMPGNASAATAEGDTISPARKGR